MVPGEQISANTMCSSSQTVVVPLGERFGVPSSQTEATKPSRCSLRTRCMSAVNFTEVAMVHCSSVSSWCLLHMLQVVSYTLKYHIHDHLSCSYHNIRDTVSLKSSGGKMVS